MAKTAKRNKNYSLSEDEMLSYYLREISKHEALSPEKEAETAIKIKKGNKKALDKLVKANLRFVVSVARNYQNQGLPLSDLINEGNIGLIRAAKRFDEKKNFKFISYAVWWIRQAILQSLANQSRIVKMPLNRVATIHKVGKAQAKLEQKYRRLPNDNELAEELGIKKNEVNETFKIGNRHTSLNAPIGNDGKGSIMDLMFNDKDEKPDDNVYKISLNQQIERMLGVLNEREQDVIRMYFGIGMETAYTLEEIGVHAGITRERVRQIKDAALKKLKDSTKRDNHSLLNFIS